MPGRLTNSRSKRVDLKLVVNAVWGVIPAAGSSTRFGADVPKQFLELEGRSVLEHSLRALLQHVSLLGVMIATQDEQALAAVLEVPALEHEYAKPIWRCAGGATRAQSVLHALLALQARGAKAEDWVAVHDAARPGLSQPALSAVLSAAFAHADGALLAMPVRDSVKSVDDAGCVAHSLDRTRIWCAQTPQVFALGLLIAALRQAPESTDEAQAMEGAGFAPKLVLGEARNLKITLAEDLPLVQYYLRQA